MTPPASQSERQSLDGSPAGRSGLGTRLHAELAEVEDWLWLIVLATLTLDVALTYEGLQRGLAEGNPLLGPAMEAAGFAVLGLTKAVVLGFAGFYRELRPELGPVIPLALALPWLTAVVVNGLLLFT